MGEKVTSYQVTRSPVTRQLVTGTINCSLLTVHHPFFTNDKRVIMIGIYDLTKRYGDQLLFEGAAFNVKRGERIGLVGRNGHGKSTLMKILVGEESSDEGRVDIPKNYSIGYLRQRIDLTEQSVLKEVCKGLGTPQRTGNLES